jgi:4-aminobutyrate aminotransferase/(S)-3-amino-2-methylpropionate transaminase
MLRQSLLNVRRVHLLKMSMGNVFLDFSSGIGVVNTGHSPDAIVNAIKSQAEKFIHTSFNILPYEGYVNVCEKLNQHAPGAFEKKISTFKFWC